MTDASTALESYCRPWSVSIDDENCRAVIRDADGLEVAYISDVVRSRAGETAQMFIDLAEERDRLREERDRLRVLVKRMANYIQVGAIGGALLREARAAIGEWAAK